MSGIIGGAGSKSGVIGTTELDYEEGTWTPTHTNASASNSGSYIKIGKKVFLEGWLASDGGASGTTFGGLPFAGVTTGNSAGGGNTNYQNNATSGLQYGIQISGSNFSFYNDATLVDFISGRQAGFHLSYTIA